MRKRFAVFLAAIVAPVLTLCQATSKFPKSPQAVDLIERILMVGGPTLDASSGTVTQGTVQLGNDASDIFPVRIYTAGSGAIRTEVDRAGGTSIRIVNGGQGSYRSPNGSTIRLNSLNTIAERISHIPTLALLSDISDEHVRLDYLGPTSIAGLRAIQLGISWSNAATADDDTELLKRTKVVYSIDPTTYRILIADYDRCAENDSNSPTHYRVFYSEYREMGGRVIPTTVTTFIDDQPSSELHITSYSENANVSLNDFDVQGASK